MRVTLLTGTAADIQGWGDMETTNYLAEALREGGNDVDIAFVRNYEELTEYLIQGNFDLIWSSLYDINDNEDFIDISLDKNWVQDYLDLYRVPYIGPSASSLKKMLNKHHTYKTLKAGDVEVPKQYYVESISDLSQLEEFKGQLFVKPCYGSNSTGIDESSVVSTLEELQSKARYILDELSQPVVIEEYLSGDEYTVLALGNDDNRFYSIKNTIDSKSYRKYPIITCDAKYEDAITFEKPSKEVQKMAEYLAYRAVSILQCHDHVRIDMRMDSEGQLKVIDVNGIPGMSPILGSRSLMIKMLYNPQYSKWENYLNLTNEIVDSAVKRCSIEHSFFPISTASNTPLELIK